MVYTKSGWTAPPVPQGLGLQRWSDTEGGKGMPITTSQQAWTSELFNGHQYLVLWRNTPTSKTDRCPFCSKCHLHTPGDGLVSSHCPIWENKKLTLSDGTTVRA